MFWKPNFKKLNKHDIEFMSNEQIEDEINGNINFLETCEEVESNCYLNEDEEWFMTIITSLLRKEFNLLKYEQSRRKQK